MILFRLIIIFFPSIFLTLNSNFFIFSMNFLCTFFLFISLFFSLDAQSAYFDHWSEDQIQIANNASDLDYLTLEEKKVFLILNLARISPKLFQQHILQSYQVPEGFLDDCLVNNRYINSLSKALLTMDPISPLTPDKELWQHAKCHAIKSGKRGYVGHKRVGCPKPDPYSECCSYGFEKAIDIVVQLLIDYQIRDLGHRKIMLDAKQKLLGVSIQPHKNYVYNAVLDFSY